MNLFVPLRSLNWWQQGIIFIASSFMVDYIFNKSSIISDSIARSKNNFNEDYCQIVSVTTIDYLKDSGTNYSRRG